MIDHLDAVDEINAEAVAGVQTLAGEKAGQPVAARIEFAEGEDAVAELEPDCVAASF